MTPPGADDAATRTMDALRRLVRALGSSARGSARSGAPSGAQLFLLRRIAAEPGLSVGALASRTFASQSTVSEVVARLVAAGLVARRTSADDARQAMLSLTARGRRAVDDSEPTAQERLAQGLASLSATERETLAASLETWLAAADLAATPASMFFEDRSTHRRGIRTRGSNDVG